MPVVEHHPCSYARHRASDWVPDNGGPVTCGICHPPAPGFAFAVRGTPLFDELAQVAAANVGPPLPRCTDCNTILWNGNPGRCGKCVKAAEPQRVS